jgi:hypothetical protein
MAHRGPEQPSASALQVSRDRARLALKITAACTAALVTMVGSSSYEASGQTATIDLKTNTQRTPLATQTLSIPSKTGVETKLNVEVADWNIGPSDTVISAPQNGFTVVSVTGGKIRVIASGVTKEYGTGSYWTIAPGASVTISLPPKAHGASVRTIIALPAS